MSLLIPLLLLHPSLRRDVQGENDAAVPEFQQCLIPSGVRGEEEEEEKGRKDHAYGLSIVLFFECLWL
jgi:hypothetical protein